MTSDTLTFADGRVQIRRLVWQELLALVVSVILIALVVIPVPAMLRFVVAVLFVVCGPGVAVLAIAGGRYFRAYHPGVVIALGFAVTILVAEIMLWSHMFYPRAGLVLLAGGTIVLVLVAARRDARAMGEFGGGDGLVRGANQPVGVNLMPDHEVPGDAALAEVDDDHAAEQDARPVGDEDVPATPADDPQEDPGSGEDAAPGPEPDSGAHDAAPDRAVETAEFPPDAWGESAITATAEPQPPDGVDDTPPVEPGQD